MRNRPWLGFASREKRLSRSSKREPVLNRICRECIGDTFRECRERKSPEKSPLTRQNVALVWTRARPRGDAMICRGEKERYENRSRRLSVSLFTTIARSFRRVPALSLNLRRIHIHTCTYAHARLHRRARRDVLFYERAAASFSRDYLRSRSIALIWRARAAKLALYHALIFPMGIEYLW